MNKLSRSEQCSSSQVNLYRNRVYSVPKLHQLVPRKIFIDFDVFFKLQW
jgi:hypothetical protein